MRAILAFLLLLAAGAVSAQMATPKPAPPVRCADCAVVRTVKAVTRELRATPGDQAKPSGMVASIPLGGSEKPQFGSSTSLGKDSRATDTRWEVTVRYEDGRYRLITLNEEPELKEGDKVRIDRDGTIRLRAD